MLVLIGYGKKDMARVFIADNLPEIMLRIISSYHSESGIITFIQR